MEPPESITFEFENTTFDYDYLMNIFYDVFFKDTEDKRFICIKCKELTLRHNQCRVCKYWNLKQRIANNRESMYEPA